VIALIGWQITMDSRYEGLDRAIWSGDIRQVRLWLFLGANVDGNDYGPQGFGQNVPLMTAVMKKRYDLAALLLEKGANPNFQYGEGVSPLVFAAFHVDVKMMKLLLSHGAKKDMPTFYGTALEAAITEKQVEAQRILREAAP